MSTEKKQPHTITVRGLPPDAETKFVFTPGRGWGRDPIVVEVVEPRQATDLYGKPVTNDEGEPVLDFGDPILPVTGKPDPIRIGQATYKQLQENPSRFVVTEGGSLAAPQQATGNDSERIRALESNLAKKDEALAAQAAEMADMKKMLGQLLEGQKAAQQSQAKPAGRAS